MSCPSGWCRAGERSDPVGSCQGDCWPGDYMEKGAFTDSPRAPVYHGRRSTRLLGSPMRNARSLISLHRGRKCLTPDRKRLAAEAPGSCSPAQVQGHLRSIGRWPSVICTLLGPRLVLDIQHPRPGRFWGQRCNSDWRFPPRQAIELARVVDFWLQRWEGVLHVGVWWAALSDIFCRWSGFLSGLGWGPQVGRVSLLLCPPVARPHQSPSAGDPVTALAPVSWGPALSRMVTPLSGQWIWFHPLTRTFSAHPGPLGRRDC